MEFSVGEYVRLADGRTGRIARITPEGHFDVNLDEDPVQASQRGHAGVRNPDDPPPVSDVVEAVPAGELAKVAQA